MHVPARCLPSPPRPAWRRVVPRLLLFIHLYHRWRHRPGKAMITRREFVATSLVGSLGAGVMLAGYRSALIPRRTAQKIHTVVVDRRFTESQQFGAALDRHGASVRQFDGDVTDLWFTRLEPLWRARRASVAGLTTYGVLFCLERLAWDHGLRVIHRAQHTPLPEGQIGSRLVPPLYSWVIALPQRNRPARSWPLPLNLQNSASIT